MIERTLTHRKSLIKCRS